MPHSILEHTTLWAVENCAVCRQNSAFNVTPLRVVQG